ncbi:MAG: arylamine N-acetyltransferase [Bacteroidota bacterium]
MNIKDYIERIHYKGDLTQSLSVLKELQASHLLSVPFENLDIHYGNFIILDMDKIHLKVVENNRGGFCYELNGLFNKLLKMIGFETKIVSARVYDSKRADFGKEYDHLAVIVTLNQEKYLVDVGFGEFAFHPLKLEMNIKQADPRGDFIIEKYENDYYKASKIDDNTKSIEYIFTETERDLNEFIEMCNYHQTSPDSHFTQKKLITRPTKSGRITMTGTTVKITAHGKTIKEFQFDERDYGTQLMEWFTIEEKQLKPGH